MEAPHGSELETFRPLEGERVWLRLPSGSPTACRPIALSAAPRPEKQWPARVRDVSREGICLALARRFEPGTVLVVDLPCHDQGGPIAQMIEVIRIAGRTARGWLLGCRFQVPLACEELRTLTSATDASNSP